LHQQRLRNRKTERLDGLRVDRQLEGGGLLDRQVAGLAPLMILSTKPAARRQIFTRSAL
jgi:hypothetical protein